MNHLIRSVRPKFLNRRQTRFQHEHETCVLCSSTLILKYEKTQSTKASGSDSKDIVREIAECPSCTIRARSTDHSVQ